MSDFVTANESFASKLLLRSTQLGQPDKRSRQLPAYIKSLFEICYVYTWFE